MVHATPAMVRLVLLSACAAVWLIQHVRLALRASQPARARVVLLALAVPGVGAVRCWRRGDRAGPVVYAVVVLAYVALRLGA